MDSLTQIALGSAVGYAVAGNKFGRKAILWGAALGTLPDLDVFYPFADAVSAFTYHRSVSHSLIVHLLMSPLIVWLMLKIHHGAAAYKLRCFWLVFLCLSTHALLDSFTVYGTQLLWPLTEHPFSLSNLFIIDPLVTVPLIVGLVIAAMPNTKLTLKTKANGIGLAVCGTYVLWSFGAKIMIDRKVEEAIALNNIQPQAIVSTPAPFTTLLWRIVIMSDGRYYESYASLLDTPAQVSIFEYSTQAHLLAPLQQAWPLQRLQWFTKGFYSVKVRNDDIILSDLRMGVECAYVFNFKVARQLDTGVELGSFEDFSQRPELSNLPKIWQRIWDPKVSLAPSRERDGEC